ncbi:pyruvate dehydrogenase kinase [Gracilaria domingensis]|nr:pyruvate dehydrogenase kinase [Gracilaria domingensis]
MSAPAVSAISNVASNANVVAAAATAVARAAPAVRQLLRPSLRQSPQALRREIARAASHSGTPLTIRELYAFGQRALLATNATRLHSAQWLHAELPVRLAHRVLELDELPYGLADMPSVKQVKQMYENSFCDIVESGLPQDYREEEQFSDMLYSIRNRHDDVVRLIAKGVIELKEHCGRGTSDLEIRSFLDRFYMSRIGIRVLMSHHLALGDPSPGMAGVINRFCKPSHLIEQAVVATRSLAYQHYGEAPDVQIRGNTELQFPYIDSHLYLCLFELLKNSLRATVETHRDADVLPPVRCIIADGMEDVTIKISDEGGGFRRSEMKGVWTYLFTTAKLPPKQLLEMEDRCDKTNRPDPIAGFGYGLPLSRLYARYWGGELALASMEGYGTDAYLHLSKLGDKKECLTA